MRVCVYMLMHNSSTDKNETNSKHISNCEIFVIFFVVIRDSGLFSQLEGSKNHNVGFELMEKSLQKKPCLLYTSPSPRDRQKSRMPSSA